jgi:hypothetical protein
MRSLIDTSYKIFKIKSITHWLLIKLACLALDITELPGTKITDFYPM